MRTRRARVRSGQVKVKLKLKRRVKSEEWRVELPVATQTGKARPTHKLVIDATQHLHLATKHLHRYLPNLLVSRTPTNTIKALSTRHQASSPTVSITEHNNPRDSANARQKMPSDLRTPRGGHAPVTTAKEKRTLLTKATAVSRKAHIRLTNMREMDYQALEDMADEFLLPMTDHVTNKDLHQPAGDKAVMATAGTTVPLYMLSRGAFTERLDEANNAARSRFPDMFGHQQKSGLAKSTWPDEEDLDILQLTDDDRDRLLKYFWLREARRLQDAFKSKSASPERPKRRGVSLATPSPMKKIKMKPIPRMANSQLSIIEVRPDGPEESRHEVKTGQVTKIWFNKFCDEGDYEEYISGARTGDLDPELFDFDKFCKLLEGDGKFKFATGQLELKKEERRYDLPQGIQEKASWVIDDPKHYKAAHRFVRMLEHFVKEAKTDSEYKFEMLWKADAQWKPAVPEVPEPET
jgi:hypothetical protein